MRRDLLLSLTTAVLLSFAYPPFRFGFLAYISLVPFFFLLRDKGYKESVRWGYLTGLFSNLGTLYWISWVTIPGAIGSILYLPIYFIFYAVVHTFIRRRLGEKYLYWCVPFLWTGIEFIRSLGVLGFPWNSLAYTQSYYLSLIQYVDYTSLFGVSFWIVVINVIIFKIFTNVAHFKKIVIYFMILIFLLILPWLYGQWVMPDKDQQAEENIKVGVIQGNIDPYVKWEGAFFEENLRIYDQMTRRYEGEGLDLIVWPETATPVYLRDSATYLNAVQDLVQELKVSLLTGTPDYKYLPDRSYITFNAAFLFTPNERNFQYYHKIHLVPFGERVPFTEALPILKSFLESLEMGEGDFSPGKELVVFEMPKKVTADEDSAANLVDKEKIRFSTIICFESVFSDLVRRFVNKGAEFLVIITNDAWFGKSQAPYHHAQIAVFRAIENRVAIARCANTGISSFIDPYGRILKETKIFQRATLKETIPLRKHTTFFSKYGHVFSVSITLFNIIPLLLAVFKIKQMNKE